MAPPSEGTATAAASRNLGDDRSISRKKVKKVPRARQHYHHANKLSPERPRKSLIRKRPVSFGNPALGTYHGCLYTLDVLGEDLVSSTSPIIIEGVESVERIVAMVDVPPEQVPEGILNLARSYRPYLHHVRIVIAEDNEEYPIESLLQAPKTPKAGSNITNVAGGQEETKEEVGAASSNQNITSNTNKNYSESDSPFQMMENAAYILAADEKQETAAAATTTNSNTTNANIIPSDKIDGKEKGDDNASIPSRTYLVLLELCSKEAAEGFVEDLHGQPYTSLDETQTCSVHQVLALTGEDGVSLLSPFFAPSTKSTTSPKANSSANAAAIPAATAAVTTTHTEDYNCAVCLEHMDLTETELSERSSILTTVCNHTFHLDCLLKWQDSPCPVCRYDHSGLNETLSQCNLCGTTEHNFVCLICGVVSCGGPPVRSAAAAGGGVVGAITPVSACGVASSAAVASSSNNNNCLHQDSPNAIPPMETSRRLSQSHARKHYDETLHAYALDTETQHVWDFAGQGYVHRLLQNKEDGKLVEVHNPANTSSHERTLSPGLSDAQEGEVLHRKLEGFASQYYTLLKSQLEQQRSYYQGRLEELRRESIMKKKSQTSDLINAFKSEKTQLSKRLVSLKAKRQKAKDDIAFLKNMNESLESNKEPLKRKVQDAQQKRLEARQQIEECLPVLEKKVTMLMLQLTGGTEEAASDNGVAAAPTAASASAGADDEGGLECLPSAECTKSDSEHANAEDASKPAAK